MGFRFGDCLESHAWLLFAGPGMLLKSAKSIIFVASLPAARAVG